MKIRLWLCCTVLALVSTESAIAKEFDIIVPAEVNVSSTSNVGLGTGAWGLLVATSEALTLTDLDDAFLTAEIDDPAVTVAVGLFSNPGRFYNTGFYAPLNPQEAAGAIFIGNLEFLQLLAPGEAVKDQATQAQVYGLSLSWPANHTSVATLDLSVQMGNHLAEYSTTMHIGNFPGAPVFEVLPGNAMRVSGALLPVGLLPILVNEVLNLNLQQGIENGLDAKLDAVLLALDDLNLHNDVAAVNALEAFINAVEAQRGRQIDEADADDLIASAQEIIDLLTAP